MFSPDTGITSFVIRMAKQKNLRFTGLRFIYVVKVRRCIFEPGQVVVHFFLVLNPVILLDFLSMLRRLI